MKRLHVNLAVADVSDSVRFYTALFAAEPTVLKDDYAKWMLDDPRVNFAISKRGGGTPGVNHLGIQVDDRDELVEVYGRLKEARGPVLEEGETTCCYAQSEKSWIFDPQGVAWETFFTHGESPVYGDSVDLATGSAQAREMSKACGCAPSAEAAKPAADGCC
jgi:catechol 2,3-dioxygenase-like lactoylglutathione lyase family enzyme